MKKLEPYIVICGLKKNPDPKLLELLTKMFQAAYNKIAQEN